jgi:hypothetical protein
VLVRTGVTSKKDMWLYVLDIPAGNQGAILTQRSRNIQRPRCHAKPAKVGVLHQVVSEITIIVFCRQERTEGKL